MQVMKKVVPPAGKVAKEARECVQERYPIKNEKSKFLGHTKGSRKKNSSTYGQAIKALPPPPSSLMAIGTFFKFFF